MCTKGVLNITISAQVWHTKNSFKKGKKRLGGNWRKKNKKIKVLNFLKKHTEIQASCLFDLVFDQLLTNRPITTSFLLHSNDLLADWVCKLWFSPVVLCPPLHSLGDDKVIQSFSRDKQKIKYQMMAYRDSKWYVYSKYTVFKRNTIFTWAT